jgi:hypothetical protein
VSDTVQAIVVNSLSGISPFWLSEYPQRFEDLVKKVNPKRGETVEAIDPDSYRCWPGTGVVMANEDGMAYFWRWNFPSD